MVLDEIVYSSNNNNAWEFLFAGVSSTSQDDSLTHPLKVVNSYVVTCLLVYVKDWLTSELSYFWGRTESLYLVSQGPRLEHHAGVRRGHKS